MNGLTQYQVINEGNYREVVFDHRGERVNIYLNTRDLTVGVSVELGRDPEGDGVIWSEPVLIEQEVFLQALQEAGMIEGES